MRKFLFTVLVSSLLIGSCVSLEEAMGGGSSDTDTTNDGNSSSNEETDVTLQFGAIQTSDGTNTIGTVVTTNQDEAIVGILNEGSDTQTMAVVYHQLPSGDNVIVVPQQGVYQPLPDVVYLNDTTTIEYTNWDFSSYTVDVVVTEGDSQSTYTGINFMDIITELDPQMISPSMLHPSFIAPEDRQIYYDTAKLSWTVLRMGTCLVSLSSAVPTGGTSLVIASASCAAVTKEGLGLALFGMEQQTSFDTLMNTPEFVHSFLDSVATDCLGVQESGLSFDRLREGLRQCAGGAVTAVQEEAQWYIAKDGTPCVVGQPCSGDSTDDSDDNTQTDGFISACNSASTNGTCVNYSGDSAAYTTSEQMSWCETDDLYQSTPCSDSSVVGVCNDPTYLDQYGVAVDVQVVFYSNMYAVDGVAQTTCDTLQGTFSTSN
ncbi:MAG: hypothetical protein JXX29_10610 [Deltaproteobacteria bacterium]|nr:hypothetical protein [Deltaproteobacteria bacterium]MBN2672119.1 hypothetical protein [Deltaproteobacteria bacterium]